MTTIDVPARNRAVKKLLQQTYPDVKVRVSAGRGTAYHWIEIEFDRRVGNPPGLLHNRVQEAIEDLIIMAGLYVSTYSMDDGYSGKCVSVRMPHQ